MFRNSFGRAAFGTLTTLLLVPPLASAAAEPQPSPSPAAEIGRVSTSDRHDEPIDRTTRSTYVVDRLSMQARGDRTVADALRNVPGVDLYSYGAFGAQASVFIRGASSTSVLVLLDGVPVTPGSNEQLDLGTFSTTGVARIEVVEGSGAALYGSSAVGGIINIITDVPRATYLEASAGTLHDRAMRVETGNGRLGVSFDRHIAANEFTYPGVSTPGAPAMPAGTRKNADAQQTAARLAYDKIIGDVTVRVRLGTTEMHLGVPGSLTYGPNEFARQNTSRTDAHLDIVRAGARSVTTLTFAGFHQNLEYIDPSSVTENPTVDGRAQVSLRNVSAGGPSTFTLGLDLARASAVLANIARYDAHARPIGYATTGQTQSESAAYGQEQYELRNGIALTAAIRAENDAPLGTALTPSVGISLPLTTSLRLLANGGAAFRVPTIVDRYYPGYANPGLKPERSRDADITLQSSALLGGASLGFFMRDATNLIQLDSAFVPQNVARASLRGLFGTVKTRAFHHWVSTLSVTDTYRADAFAPRAAAARLLFTPVVVTKLGLERSFGSGGYSVGAQANVFGPHAESTGLNSDGQATVDVFVRGRLTRDLIVSARARNVGNERYQPILGYPAAGRTIEFAVSTQ